MRIAVLLSGGVDSSVAMRLLQQQGHDLVAFYLKIWLEDELAFLGECPWEEDLSYAREVCDQAGVKLEVVSLQREYHDKVVAWAIEELRQGRTPSPDILCNQHIKFGAFLDVLEQRLDAGFDRIASGHYARLRTFEEENGQPSRVELLQGIDPVKDQTYFLYQLNQHQLERCLFPLGGYQKADVRTLATDLSLPNRNRKDSQGICFLGKIQYDEFVRAHLGDSPGPIRCIETNKVMGRHQGHWFYTIGQRKGLGLGAGPWYVVGKDPTENVVWISHKDTLPNHRRDCFEIPAMHWIHKPFEPGTHQVGVKIRHSPQTTPGSLVMPISQDEPIRIELCDTDPGIASGQAAVIYQEHICIGGGQIQLTP